MSQQKSSIAFIQPLQSGFTLIELMLASAFSLFLLTGLIQVYLANQKTWELQNALMSMGENGRFATHMLMQEILMAGYSGCEKEGYVNQDLAIHGYEEDLPDFLKGKVQKGADSIVIGRCNAESGKTQFSQHAFIVSSTSRKNILGNKILALYDAPMNANKRELVSGVTHMKILYGVEDGNNESISAYLPAKQVKDWRLVHAVEIALLLTSEQPIFPKPQSYTFLGSEMPADRFLHREWDVYVHLRER